jgi:hypothetical protein
LPTWTIRTKESCVALTSDLIIASMKNTTKLLIAALVLLFVGIVIYSSMGLGQFRCEVCMDFQGRSSCATASGTSQEEARRTATETACAKISSGMTESIACAQTSPRTIQFK